MHDPRGGASAACCCGGVVQQLMSSYSFVAQLIRVGVTMAVHSTLGLLQAHHPRLTLIHVLRNVHSRKCVMQCVMLNLLLFRGALYVYESLLPALCLSVLGVRLLGDWRYEIAILALWAAPAYIICEIVTTSLHYKMAQKLAASDPPPQIIADGMLPAERPSSCARSASQTAAVACSGSVTNAVADVSSRIEQSADGAHSHSAAVDRTAYDDSMRADGSPTDRAQDDENQRRDAMLSFFSIVYTRLVYLVFMLQIQLICGLPVVGPVLTLVLSALLHAYDSFEFIWNQQGYGVAERFALIESHWVFFLGYGGVLAFLSVRLRFWDLFVVRTMLYPIYIANAPHARFQSRKAGLRLPVFRAPVLLFNAVLQLVAASLARA